MFRGACDKNRKAIYAIHAFAQVAKNQQTNNNGTGFMVSPGIIATASHVIHRDNDVNNPLLSTFNVIKSVDIGNRPFETSTLVAEDQSRDIALLKIENPRSNDCVILEREKSPSGTICGSLGFPLAQLVQTSQGLQLQAPERFQGSFISGFTYYVTEQGKPPLPFYETDRVMYPGSSGCPGFLTNSKIFGMHVRSLTDAPNKIGKKGDVKRNIPHSSRLSISLWVPSQDIVSFAENNEIILAMN